ncbi:DNA polymerase III subunit alpha [Patescibacteria group bacterium]|nr:DNA polymerase III subunit alpha [Patescibacteria group bacterium]MBU4458322.1 DNA polymerase III subunit alpha [Patescibacteria group bacterium]MCG2695923.1 DNA polymerase III subunit alpha [Candidatus Portnoybacteria bacterium]
MAEQKFTHLHVHSHYSLLDGLAKIDELIEKAKATGMDSLALTDHGTMYGVVEFYKKATSAGIKPIIGVETYLVPGSRFDKTAGKSDIRYHLILLAKDKTGYHNLIKLVTKAHLEGFYYKPRIDKEILKEYHEGLIALTACPQGEIPSALLADDIAKAKKLTLEYSKLFGKDNFYLEIMDHPNDLNQVRLNEKIVKLAKETNLPLVATNDVHYLNKEDADVHDVLLCVQTNRTVGEKNRMTMKGEDYSLKPPDEMISAFRNIPEAIESTQKIADMCNLKLELDKIELPHFPLPEDETANSYLKKLCEKGLRKRDFGENLNQAKKQLKFELGVIEKTGFASYFLIVQDVVNWAKNNNIVVGPGRGSAAGSIVSYLLNITNVDPLKYKLLFERFLNPERISMPDIDLDFADIRRNEIVNYVAKKYGADHVAQIITFGTMASRAAIRDTGRALGYTYAFCDQIAKMIPFGFGLKEALEKVPELSQSYDTDDQVKILIDIATKLEGVARHASTHACGIVITKNPIDFYAPRQFAPQDENSIVTQYEMHSIEALGLLKMDFLGLKNLTTIETALNLIEKLRGIKINIDDIPLDDKKTFELFKRVNTVGVFQLESSGMRKYLQKLKPNDLEDIIVMISLYRPGPMDLIPDYIARKHGEKEIKYVHPKLEPILKNTYGITVYQEQLMQIAKDLAGFTMSEADVLRKAVGKKIRKLLEQQADKMIDGMVKNGIDKEIAQKIWDSIEPFAQYGFNRSHATCYALIAYQTAYLKANYPEEFITALMQADQKDLDRINILVDEAKKMGIQVLAPDINESFDNFTLVPASPAGGPPSIRFGLAAIKNVGHNVVAAIVEERKQNGNFQTMAGFLTRLTPQAGKSAIINKKSLENLIRAGAFDALAQRKELLEHLEELLEFSKESQKTKDNGQASLFGEELITNKNQLLFTNGNGNGKRKLLSEEIQWEKDLLGMYISDHPLKNHEGFLKGKIIQIRDLLKEKKDSKVKIAGVIIKITKFITKSGKPMLFVKAEDLTSAIEILVFATILEKNPTIWQEGKVILVEGRLTDKDDQLKILCDNAEEII